MDSQAPLNRRLQTVLSLLQENRGDEAKSLLQAELSADQDKTHERMMQAAAAYFGAQNFKAALAALQASLIIEPDRYDAHHNAGVALALLGREKEAIEAYKKAIQLAPGFIPAHVNLAGIYYAHKAYAKARELTEKVIELQPDTEQAVEAYCNLYDVYQKLDYPRERCYRQLEKAMAACRGNPTQPQVFLNLANYYELTHDLESCRKVLQVALERFPDCDRARYLMAVCLRREGQYALAARLLGQCDPRRQEPRELADIHFEFGKCFDGQQAYGKAMEHLARANDIARSLHRNTTSGTLVRARNHNARLSPEWSLKTDPAAMDAPVFLIGFPRSGTTLLELILDSHPRLQTLEEKPVIRAVVKRLARIDRTDLMAAIDTLDETGLQSLRELYLRTRAGYAPGTDGKLIVDKLPLATINVPVLFRLFPKARFVLAIRHPLDTLLSCYMQNFGPNDAMGNFYDLGDAAELYCNTMEIWKKSVENLPLDAHRIRYEDLVEDPEAEIRALLEFLHIPWHENVLEFHQHARQKNFINTPSYSQVVQPIYGDARGRWRHYAEPLAGVRDRVQPFIEYFGYEPSNAV